MSERHPNASGNESHLRSRRFLLGSAALGVVLLAVVLGALMWLDGDDERDRFRAASDAELAALTESTTYAKIRYAPKDHNTPKAAGGQVVHPPRLIAIYDAPYGKPFAKIGPKQLGNTWLPVVEQREGWRRVLLPSKPNGSTGWLRTQDVKEDRTEYVIKVHLGSRTLELLHNGKQAGEWPVGIGKKDTPTPTGRTFLLGSFEDPKQQFSPVILPLGSHSETLDEYGGGPGTVAIHGWPATEVFGTESSHGCIQVPQDALDRLTEVPLGTLVLVDQQ